MNLKQLGNVFHAAFTSSDGVAALGDLTEMFDRPAYVRGDTHETAYRAGQQSVIEYIRRTIENGRRGRAVPPPPITTTEDEP